MFNVKIEVVELILKTNLKNLFTCKDDDQNET